MPCNWSFHDVCFCLCDIKSIKRIQISVCLYSHGIYIPRWGPKLRFILNLSFCASGTCRWLGNPWCKFLCCWNNNILLLLSIAAIMDLWNEILGERHALLINSSLCLIIKSQIHQLDRYYNLHTCHAGHVHLVFGYFPWIRQQRFVWLI